MCIFYAVIYTPPQYQSPRYYLTQELCAASGGLQLPVKKKESIIIF